MVGQRTMATDYYAEFEVTDNSGNNFVIRNVAPYSVPNSFLNAMTDLLSPEEVDYVIAMRMQRDLLPHTLEGDEMDDIFNDISEIVRNESQEDSAVVHPKLTVTEFNSLSSKRFSKAFKKEGFKQSACAICSEEFRSNQKLPILRCGHHFHWKCLKEWVTKHRASCPVCMGDIKNE